MKVSLKKIRKATELHCDILNSQVHLGSIYRDVRCGLRSNIPVCCILFFIIRGLFYYFINFSLVKKFICYYPPKTLCKYNYVPCFICFLFHRVRKLYVCSEEDITCCCYGKPPICFLSEEKGTQNE